MNLSNMNILVLAYIGDAIFELKIREYLISKNISKVANLQKQSIEYVSANAQSKFLNELISKEILTLEELNIIKRARNYKSKNHPKNVSLKTYKEATGLEALIGYLYYTDNNERIEELIRYRTGE